MPTGAAAAFKVATRTADRPHGPCRVLAPLSSTETDEGKGRGGWARGALRVTTEAPSSPAGALQSRRRAGGDLAELLNLEEDVLDAGRLVDRFFQVPELVIEVPKISLDVIPLRALVPEPQLAEQLVEVPTIVSFSSLQRIMEQTVDIPVPQGGGGRVGVRSLQGFPGQSSTAYCGCRFPCSNCRAER